MHIVPGDDVAYEWSRFDATIVPLIASQRQILPARGRRRSVVE